MNDIYMKNDKIIKQKLDIMMKNCSRRGGQRNVHLHERTASGHHNHHHFHSRGQSCKYHNDQHSKWQFHNNLVVDTDDKTVLATLKAGSSTFNFNYHHLNWHRRHNHHDHHHHVIGCGH